MLAVIADSKISVASHDINFSHNVHCGHFSCDFKIIEVSNSFLGSNNLRMDIRESMKIIAGNLGEESLGLEVMYPISNHISLSRVQLRGNN